jgi:glycolate oxidase iron-sulfur subunit
VVQLAAQEQKLLACIHCGLCLEACPTYVITGNENDGPRGRLYLMRAVAEGRLENTSDAFRTHIDRCLGCRACEQVCPAGVEYGLLLESSREELQRAQPKTDLTNRMLRFVLRYVWLSPWRLRLLFGGARVFRDLGLSRLLLKSGIAGLLSRRAVFGLGLLESSSPVLTAQIGRKDFRESESDRAQGAVIDRRKEAVLMFAGCVGEGLFARVNRATERVLRAHGFEVKAPAEQVCCGALHAHAGDLEGARELARKNVRAFASAAPIITNAGGCGAMLATYGHLLANDPNLAATAAKFSGRVRDVSQQLQVGQQLQPPDKSVFSSVRSVAHGVTLATSGERRVTYDTSCHLLYGQRAGEASQEMLRSAVGQDFVPLEGTERCCGAAGVYNLLQPELSGRVLQEKLDHISKTEATILATGNPGCQMHIGAGARSAGMNLKVCHPIELVDEAYAAAGVYSDGK